MIAEELHCTVTEAKLRVDPQAYLDKLSFWESHPPMRDHLNICIAQVTQMTANVNRGKHQKARKLSDFIIDYKKAKLPSRKQVAGKIKNILGAFVKKG
jgi:hypothetical protein